MENKKVIVAIVIVVILITSIIILIIVVIVILAIILTITTIIVVLIIILTTITTILIIIITIVILIITIVIISKKYIYIYIKGIGLGSKTQPLTASGPRSGRTWMERTWVDDWTRVGRRIESGSNDPDRWVVVGGEGTIESSDSGVVRSCWRD